MQCILTLYVLKGVLLEDPGNDTIKKKLDNLKIE
jgi:hypothetical protein